MSVLQVVLQQLGGPDRGMITRLADPRKTGIFRPSDPGEGDT